MKNNIVHCTLFGVLGATYFWCGFAQDSDFPCEDDSWTFAAQSCFKVFPDMKPWDKAQEACMELGEQFHLATALTEAELNATVAVYLSQAPEVDEIWLGAQRDFSVTPPVWRWVTGERIDIVQHWGNGQPNYERSNCLLQWTSGEEVGFWNDFYCTQLRPYMCQMKLFSASTSVPTSVGDEDELATTSSPSLAPTFKGNGGVESTTFFPTRSPTPYPRLSRSPTQSPVQAPVDLTTPSANPSTIEGGGSNTPTSSPSELRGTGPTQAPSVLDLDANSTTSGPSMDGTTQITGSPASAVTASPVPPSQCSDTINAEWQRGITQNLDAELERCALECLDTEDDYRACTAMCFGAKTPLSYTCKSCFGKFSACLNEVCLCEGVRAVSEACSVCSTKFCESDFAECTGWEVAQVIWVSPSSPIDRAHSSSKDSTLAAILSVVGLLVLLLLLGIMLVVAKKRQPRLLGPARFTNGTNNEDTQGSQVTPSSELSPIDCAIAPKEQSDDTRLEIAFPGQNSAYSTQLNRSHSRRSRSRGPKQVDIMGGALNGRRLERHHAGGKDESDSESSLDSRYGSGSDSEGSNSETESGSGSGSGSESESESETEVGQGGGRFKSSRYFTGPLRNSFRRSGSASRGRSRSSLRDRRSRFSRSSTLDSSVPPLIDGFPISRDSNNRPSSTGATQARTSLALQRHLPDQPF